MTWLEIMDVLDKMPRHLLKEEASLWHYDEQGEYEVLPVHDVVSPLNDGKSKEWEPGGNYHLSLQSFNSERKPVWTEVPAREDGSCPVCGADCESAEGVDIQDPFAIQECTCENGHSYTCVYRIEKQGYMREA